MRLFPVGLEPFSPHPISAFTALGKSAQMKGHRDICLPVLSSISDTSVGCSCPDIGGRKGIHSHYWK